MSEALDALNEGLEELVGASGGSGDGETLTLHPPGAATVNLWGLVNEVPTSHELEEDGLERAREGFTLLLLRSQNSALETALGTLGRKTLRTGWLIKRGNRNYRVDSCRYDPICHEAQLSEEG